MNDNLKTKFLIYSVSIFLIILAYIIFHGILHELGIKMIRNLQSTQAPNNFFKIFAFLGSKPLKLYIFIFIYCFCNLYHSFLYVLLSYFSLFLSASLKIFYHETRPFLEFQDILALECETGYGYPSNHVLTSIPAYLIFFDILFVSFGLDNNKNAKTFEFIGHSLLMIFFILLAISRMVIGVHNLHQVLFAFILGYLIYFLFTDFLGFNLKPEAQSHFIEVCFNKQKIWRYLYLLIFIYLFFLMTIIFIDIDEKEKVFVVNYVIKCGQQPKLTPYQKSFINSTEFFAILGGMIGIYIDKFLNNLNSTKEFIFENLSNSRKNMIGNWNDTNILKGLIRVLIGVLLVYFDILLIKNILNKHNNLIFNFFFTGFLSLFMSMIFFFGFSKMIFKYFNVSNQENHKNNELKENLISI